MPLLFTFNLQTKFEVSSFIRSRDMALAKKNVEMGHVTLVTPTWRIVSHHKANNMANSYTKFEVSIIAVADIFQGV